LRVTMKLDSAAI